MKEVVEEIRIPKVFSRINVANRLNTEKQACWAMVSIVY